MRLLSCVIAIALLCPLLGHGDVSAPLTGSRTSTDTGGVTGTVNWDDGDFDISWNIIKGGYGNPGTYHYVYTITQSGGDQVKNFFLQVGNSLNHNSIVNSNRTFTGPSLQNFFGVNDYVVNFALSSGATTVDFWTFYAPVWGDFWAQGNQWYDVAFNSDIGNTPLAGGPFTDYIARPGNIYTPIPEPATYLMLGSMLAAVIFMKRRERKTN